MTLREWLELPGNTQRKLAERIGVTQSAVSQWLQWLDGGLHDNASRITGERALEIEQATDGAVTRAELRPDLFGEPSKAA